jgi:sigma-54 specific flagellar transcriptional regulator A
MGSTLAKAAPASDDSSRDAALPDDEGGPLSSNEAEATQIAYQQVRRGEVSLADMKRQIERDCIVRALSETHGNITKAAALLGMKRPRLSQLAKQYGLTANVTEAVGCDVS